MPDNQHPVGKFCQSYQFMNSMNNGSRPLLKGTVPFRLLMCLCGTGLKKCALCQTSSALWLILTTTWNTWLSKISLGFLMLWISLCTPQAPPIQMCMPASEEIGHNWSHSSSLKGLTTLWDFKVVKKWWGGALISVNCCCFVWKPSWESHAIFELARLKKKMGIWQKFWFRSLWCFSYH